MISPEFDIFLCAKSYLTLEYVEELGNKYFLGTNHIF